MSTTMKKRTKYERMDLRDKSIELYNKGLRNYEICKEIGINSHLLKEWLDEELPDRKHRPGNCKTIPNENYFEEINSKDKAYFLGLLYADGNVYRNPKQYRYRLQIFLQSQDYYILECFKNYINHSGKLYNDRDLGMKLIIDNKKIFEDLGNLGIRPNKTFDISFPAEDILPKELQSHFIRGYFDGDGCVSIIKSKHLNVSFTSNPKFLEGLSKILQNNDIYCSKFKKRYKLKDISSGSIEISRRKDQLLLYNYLYQDCDNLHLTRKKDKFNTINFIKIKRKSKYD